MPPTRSGDRIDLVKVDFVPNWEVGGPLPPRSGGLIPRSGDKTDTLAVDFVPTWVDGGGYLGDLAWSGPG